MEYTKHRKKLVFFRYLYFVLGLCAILIAPLANSPAPTRAASPDGFYEGRVEIIDCTQIKGWAWDIDRPNESINVDIYDGPNLIITIPANRFRQDLLNAGKGNGYHGFLTSIPSFLKDGQVHLISVKFGGTPIHLTGSSKNLVCKASLFPTAVPTATASGEDRTWEQGVEFSSSLSGVITKVRFWRADQEPQGEHYATLWSASGQPLKTVRFNETTAPGWQYANFNFSINANDRYKLTYNIHSVVAKSFGVFNSGPILSGPLTAHGSWYGTPAFSNPTTGSTSNFFADIEFNSPR
jgi:Domain of unknown function (DUF4082)